MKIGQNKIDLQISKGSLTLGIDWDVEGCSCCLQGLTNEELMRGVKTAWDRGWRQVKLYFMIGLPGELDEDVLGIAETILWLQSTCREVCPPRPP